MSFAGMDQIFGKVLADRSEPHSTAIECFMFHVHPLQRDAVGSGGSWSEFVDYVTASLKLEDVKLVMEGSSESGGALHAKLIAQKSKGMPRVSISLRKLVDGAACKAMGTGMSLAGALL